MTARERLIRLPVRRFAEVIEQQAQHAIASVVASLMSCRQNRWLAPAHKPSEQATAEGSFTHHESCVYKQPQILQDASFASCGQNLLLPKPPDSRPPWGLAAQPHLGVRELMDATPALH